MKLYIDIILATGGELFVALADVEDNISIEEVKNEYPTLRYVDMFENKGMDIGGFFQCLDKHYDVLSSYQYILKLHTKTSRAWREVITNPLCGNYKQIVKSLTIFQDDEINLIGAVGDTSKPTHLFDWGTKLIEYNYFDSAVKTSICIKKLFQPFSYSKECIESTRFQTGSVFWIRTKFLQERITKCVLREILKDFVTGRPDGDSFPHYWERLFWILNRLSGGKAFWLQFSS